MRASTLRRVAAIIIHHSAFILLLAGCSDTGSYIPVEMGSTRDVNERLFDSAIGLLNRLDEFDSEEALAQVVERLEQRVAAQRREKDWRPAALVESLPESLAATPLMRKLDAMQFALADGPMLQETVWLREAARFAIGRETEPLGRARELLDWTVRNFQLEPPSPSSDSNAVGWLSWQILLRGRATADERAWIFALLARQHGLDVVILATLEDGEPRVWLPALVHGGQLHLFDAQLGVPIPRPNSNEIATLTDAIADAEVLSQLNVEGHDYRIKPEMLKKVVALVPASPQNLSERMHLVESRLAGRQRMELTVDADGLAIELRKLPNIADVQLWELPIARARPATEADRERWQKELLPFSLSGRYLWKGRVLELCGRMEGDHGALMSLMHARPSEEEIETVQAAGGLDPKIEAAVRAGKLDASYWLGIASFERGNLDAAIDYFSNRVLAVSPDGPWTEGARYNLARTYEAQGKFAEAVRTLKNTQGPQRAGNLLRAKWIAER